MKITVTSKNIINYREKKGWSQEDLAKKANISLEQEKKYERGGEFTLPNKSLLRLLNFITRNP